MSWLSRLTGIDIDFQDWIDEIPVVGDVVGTVSDIFGSIYDTMYNAVDGTVKALNSGSPAAVGAVAEAAGVPGASKIGSALETSQQNEKNRDFQLELQRRSQDFTTSEREASQVYQSFERVASQDWQNTQWQTQLLTGQQLTLDGAIAAGINPNTAVSALSGSLASTPSSTNLAAPQGEVVGAPSPAPQFSVVESMAQAAKSFSEADLNKALKNKAAEETKGIIIDNQWIAVRNENQVAELKGKIDLMKKEGKLTDEQAEQLRVLTPELKRKTVQEVNNLCAQINLIAAQGDKTRREMSLLAEQIETEKHRQFLMDNEAREAYWNSEQSKKSIKYLGRQMSLVDAQKVYTDLQSKAQKEENHFNRWMHLNGITDKDGAVSFLVKSGTQITRQTINKLYELCGADEPGVGYQLDPVNLDVEYGELMKQFDDE